MVHPRIDMRDLTELNLNIGGLAVVNPAPSGQEVLEFEREFDVKLPSDYISLLRYSNGGHPELSLVRIPETGTEWEISWFYHLNGDRNDSESLWFATSEWMKVLGVGRVPFARDDGGNQFFLDLRSGSTNVGLCIHDEDFRLVFVATDFAQLIDHLTRPDDS